MNGEANSASKKHNSATIVVDDRQFCYRINPDGVFGTHTEEDRQVNGLIFGTQALGRMYLSPPGTPEARRNALRAGLLKTLKDPQFVADTTKSQIETSPWTAEEVEQFIALLSSTSPATIERVKQATRTDQGTNILVTDGVFGTLSSRPSVRELPLRVGEFATVKASARDG